MKVFNFLATLKSIVLLTCLLGSNCFAGQISSESLKKGYAYNGSCEVKRAGIKYKADRYSPNSDRAVHATVSIEKDGVVFTDEGPMYYFLAPESCAEITECGVIKTGGVDLNGGEAYLAFIDVATKEKLILFHNLRTEPKVVKIGENSYLVLGFLICEWKDGSNSTDGCEPSHEVEHRAWLRLKEAVGSSISPVIFWLGSTVFTFYTFPKPLPSEAIKPEFRIYLNELMLRVDYIKKERDHSEFLDSLLMLMGLLDKLKEFGIEVADQDLANRYQIPVSTILAMRGYWSDIRSNKI
jgi:hypothetical protein